MKNYIIPIFIPHSGCPNMCVFCNQQKITGLETPVAPAEVHALIAGHLANITRPYHIEAAFYGGSFTALSLAAQNRLLEPACEFLRQGRLHSLRLSTRPDAINREIMDNLAAHGVSIIELGVQSLADDVLQAAERGHTADDVVAAVECIRQYKNIRLGLQLMPGLPGDTAATMQRTLELAVSLKPDMVRIYPTVVLENTQLAVMYRDGQYQPLALEEAVRIAALMKLKFERHHINVIRTGLQAAENLSFAKSLVAGPYHPAFGELTESYIFWLGLEQLLNGLRTTGAELTLYHALQDTSKLRGLKNANTKRLLERYALSGVQYKQSADLSAGTVRLNLSGQEYMMQRSDILPKARI